MNRHCKSALILGLLAGLVFARHAAAADYAVIVNSDNPVLAEGEAARETVKRIYLKELGQWPDGSPAQPLARTGGSPAQEAFVAKVLEMTGASVNDHWARLKQTKGETPPREVNSALVLFRTVGREKGGLAVLTADELLDAPAEVSVLFRFSD